MAEVPSSDKAREAEFSQPPPPYTAEPYAQYAGYSPDQTPSAYGYHPSQPPPAYDYPGAQPSAGAYGYVYPPREDVPPGGAPIQHQPAVFVQQPAPLANPPRDYLVYAIVVTLMCCWPIGIFAIWKAVGCREEIARGNRFLASEKSRQARNMSHIALGVGVMVAVTCAAVFAVRLMVVLPSLSNDD